jgi:hypothetical protein
VKKPTRFKPDPVARPDMGQRILIPALVAVGGSLAIAPAFALELGDIKVHSTLGQPLRASIAYALAPNEALSDTCVSLQPGLSSGGLPSVDRASLIVADGVIAITGRSLVREPLMTLRVNVRCPYTPNLSREYMLMVDPAGRADTVMATAAAATPIASRPLISAPVAAPARSVARRSPANTDPIRDATRYQVQAGDSLSEIAQRIENRPSGVWSTVNMIFDANPGAFVDGDPNRLKAGSWLDLPNFAAADAATVTAVTPTATPAVIENIDPVADNTAYEPAASAMSDAPMADFQPGDVIVDSDNPFVTPAGSVDAGTTIIPETLLDAPVVSSTSPNVPVAVLQTSATAEPSTVNWLLWFVGGGIALIAGLLLFGRFGNRFGSTPISTATVAPRRRQSDGNTERVETLAEPDFSFPDEAPLPGQLELDADLIVGTGLQEGTDVDIAQDFAFASTTTIDFDLPEEMSSNNTGNQTDIIPAVRIDVDSILDKEVLPDDDDYDMSVIMDATKMPHPDDITERDLEAIQMDIDDETLITNEYTVSQEVDYKILEQDYEDEMTATQALNLEIAKASAELSANLDEDRGDATAEMPLATVTELDVTAQLPATNDDDISDLDDTGVNPTINMDANDNTVEMPRRDNERTVEMEIKSGKVDTKAG